MLRKHIPFLYALALALTVTVCFPSISVAGYLYQRTVTIDHTKVPNTDQSNFPVLFSGTYSYLATLANGSKVTSTSGYDIIFTSDAAGATTLDHEIETYTATTGAVNFWVRVPTVSHTTEMVIYLCYGKSAISSSQENKTGVWDSNFKGVWHLKEDPSGTAPPVKDSTSNANHGTSNGAMTQTSVLITSSSCVAMHQTPAMSMWRRGRSWARWLLCSGMSGSLTWRAGERRCCVERAWLPLNLKGGFLPGFALSEGHQ